MQNTIKLLLQAYAETCSVVMLRRDAVCVFPFCPATEGALVLEDALFMDIPVTVEFLYLVFQ